MGLKYFGLIVCLIFSVHIFGSGSRTLKPQSELRPAWGIKYDYLGDLIHGINYYHLMVGLKIPNFLFSVKEIEQNTNYCKEVAENDVESTLYFTCKTTWPIYMSSLKKEQLYRKQINHIITQQFPAVIPGFKIEEDDNEMDLNIFHQGEILVNIDDDGNVIFGNVTMNMGWRDDVNEPSTRTRFKLSEDDRSAPRLYFNNTTRQDRSVQGSDGTLRNKYKQSLETWLRTSESTPNSSPLTQTPKPKAKRRQKRFVSTVLDLAFRGLNTYLDHRKDHKMFKAFKILNRNQKKLRKDVIALRRDMMSIAEASLKEFEHLKFELVDLQKQIKYFGTSILLIQDYLQAQSTRLTDTADAIRFLTIMSSVLLVKMERYLATYEQIISELDHFLDSLDNLSNGLLSHTVIAPDILERLLNHVGEQLKEYYPDYALVLDKVHQYYNLPFVHFGYVNGTILIQIPLFIKPKKQEPLLLYDIKTVPVPYHMNEDMIDSTESKYAQTWLKPKEELLAMSSDTYITLDRTELEHCFKYKDNYFCEHLQLIKHNSDHTCESAIYWNQPIETIKEKCDIQYYPELKPEPMILDAGDQLLLVGLSDPWLSMCSQKDQIPNPLKGGEYVVLHKSDLCLCSITSGVWYLQENMQYCNPEVEPSAKIDLKYTINMAVYIHMYEEKVRSGEVNDSLLLDKWRKEDPTELKFWEESQENVIDSGKDVKLPYADVVEIQKKKLNYVYSSDAKKALAMNDIETWPEEKDNHIFGFLLGGAILAVIGFLIGTILYCKVCGMNSKFKTMSNLLSKFTIAQSMASLNQRASAQAILTCSSNELQIERIYWIKLIGMSALIYLMLLILFKLGKYVYNHFHVHNLNEVRHRYSFGKLCLMDRSNLYIFLTNPKLDRMVPIYLGSHIGSPDMLHLSGKLKPKHIKYKKGWMYDNIILCTTLKLSVEGYNIILPSTVQISMLEKLNIMMKLNTGCLMARIVSVYNETGSIKPLSTLLPVQIKYIKLNLPKMPMRSDHKATDPERGENIVHVHVPSTSEAETRSENQGNNDIDIQVPSSEEDIAD